MTMTHNQPTIIPKPVALQYHEGVFTLLSQTVIVYTDPRTEEIATYLAEVLAPPLGYRLLVTDHESRAKCPAITLCLVSEEGHTSPEAYSLKVMPGGIRIAAAGPAGLFYGVQTLRQLLPPEIMSPFLVTRTPWQVPAVTIHDAPRFAWRGLMLDVSRHFYSKEFILKFLDVMALHKLNTFHFHLCDNQGWRLEIAQFPRLTTVGARRASSPLIGDRHSQDGIPYGPYFYTQEEIREIVDYARCRAITVVPEIEMPGHCLAALAAYPEYSCTGGPFQVRTCSGYEQNVYCAGNEGTFTFLQRVLDEVMALFPSRVIHIGGDECPTKRWQACPACQQRLREEGLPDEHALQGYVMRRMARYLAQHGRRVIGWDEILDGGLPDDAAVMSWRGTSGGEAAARLGHDVVMSPTTHCYFDFYQSDAYASEPEAICGLIPLQQVYNYDPSAGELSEAERRHIIGVQGNLWTEYMRSYRQVEYMSYPRAAALAEVAWTPQECRSYDNFLSRLAVHCHRLDLLDVHYRCV